MKVFNLTHVETRQLRYQGLVGCPIRDKFGVIIKPGECKEVRGTPENRKYLMQHFVVRGAVALDQPPKGYTFDVGEAESPKPAPSSPAPKPAAVEEKTPDTQPAGSETEVAEEGSKKKKRSSHRSS